MRLEGLSFLLFGGKGGNGKTTGACATALYLASQQPEKKVLIVSTDPAHSIGDSFGCSVGSLKNPIKGTTNLWAHEIVAEEEARLFSDQYGTVLKLITERGTWLDKEDIDGFFSLTLPGLDEVMAVIKIARLLKEGEFQLIIVDTAPTGHTMKLLAMPAEMEKWISVLALMQAKHRFLMKQFTGRYRKDESDSFLLQMQNDIKQLQKLLKNPRDTLFIPVVIPESLPIVETGQFLSVLKQHGIPTQYLIVNQVKSKTGQCPVCTIEVEAQQQWMEMINEQFHTLEFREVPAFPREINGLDGLREFGKYLFEDGPDFDSTTVRLTDGKKQEVLPSATLSEKISYSETNFIIVGGKGGVGKTSLASALALQLAKENPARKVLIFSTDPAHSLSDSFSVPIGENIVRIVADLNLFGIEINAVKLLEEFKQNYRENINALFGGVGDINLRFDREILQELVSASPPGLDELMGLVKVMDMVDKQQYDLYVFDSAATGHLLNFLAMPDIVRDWLKMVFRLQIKYQNVIDLNRIGHDLLELSKKVRHVRKLLTDPERSEFIAVTIPELMGVRELNRLLKCVAELNIPGSSIVVNRVRPGNDCPFCSVKHKEEQQLISKLVKQKSADYRITQVPLFASRIEGMGTLTELGQAIW